MISGRVVIGAVAVGLYLAAIGCATLTGAATAGVVGDGPVVREETASGLIVPVGLPYRGVSIPIQRVDWIDRYATALDEVAADGCDTVLFQVDCRQENGSSSHIYLDQRVTPTPEQLGALIDHAKLRKLRVVLMPIVLLDKPRGDEWRAQLSPESWDDWFDSYRDALGLFAWVAQSHHADVMVIGSELRNSEQYVEQWTRTIRHVRQTFTGPLTYSANWDAYREVKFWDQLDLVGISCYFTVGRDRNVTAAEAEARWREIRTGFDQFAGEVHKPVFFTEVGWCSLPNAALEPWDYTKTDLEADPDLQRRLYEAFFNVWYGDPKLGGFLIWQWPPGDPDPKGYTPKGKPAEQVLRQWLAKGPWPVQ